MATIQEAIDKGFLKASKIKVAHVDITINIPTDVILYKNNNGNIYFKDSNGNDSFPEELGHFKWASIIYEADSGKWAKITEYREESMIDLLAEAKKRYPIGTTFNNTSILGLKDKQPNNTITRDFFSIEGKNILYTDLKNMRWTVYNMGKWAEIIESKKEDLVGRYIKVLKPDLGGNTSNYKKGDYLKVLNRIVDCYNVEHVGILNLSFGPNHRVYMKDVELMPEGFDPTVKLGTAGNYPKLDKFPEGGVCWNPTKQLYDYLILRTTASPLPSVKDPYKALAWNSNNIWGVQASSSQPVYDISQLEPFLNTPKEPDMIDRDLPPKPQKIGLDFMSSPTTDNFEIGKTYYVRCSKEHDKYMITKCEGFNTLDKDRINGPYISNMMGELHFNKGDTPWINSQREVCLASEKDTYWLEYCIKNKKFIELESLNRYPEPLVSEIKVGDKVIVDYPGNLSDGLKGIVEKIYKEDGLIRVEFARPLPKYPGGGELFATLLHRVKHYSDIPDYQKHYPLTPDVCYYPLPDKWCIKVTHQNQDILQEFMLARKREWACYNKDWKIDQGDRCDNYFHYPPASLEPCHSHWKIQKGYTEITTEQFKQFYNSKSNSNVRQEQECRTSSGSSIKIQRPNLEIRHSDTIRATSFRCTKGKINLGG